MIEFILIILPLVFAAAIFGCGKHSLLIRKLLIAGALLHFSGVMILDFFPESIRDMEMNWLNADSMARVVVSVSSLLFLCAAINAFFWLPAARRHEAGEFMRENVFCALLCLFLSTMTLTAFARNFGLLWVAVEATTLASAPLIGFHRSPGALEAMWKYLLICSVGIGLALFGTFMLGIAIRSSAETGSTLDFLAMSSPERVVHIEWFKAAFLFCFAGYGLKMGLAPFHTWLPDAHSEAPSLVSVLLSGALLNCAFLGIVRVLSVAPPELAGFCREYLIGFGLLSLAVAAFFLIRQADYKRMLAYSSVEHMGLLALMWGLNLTDMALIHLSMHSVCKMILFFTAGNILLASGTRKVDKISGLFSRLPLNSLLWLFMVLLICGAPPSPLFITEFLLVGAAGPWLGGTILLLLFIVFCAMTLIAMNMTMNTGEEKSGAADAAAEKLAVLPLVLTPIPIAVGIYLICKLAGVLL